jgi:hypothetical protein
VSDERKRLGIMPTSFAKSRDELALAGEATLHRYLNERHIGFLQNFLSAGDAAMVDVLMRCESGRFAKEDREVLRAQSNYFRKRLNGEIAFQVRFYVLP